MAAGFAIEGYKPIVEIMFGDFMTLCFDQIVNHASKFHHMYNKKINCPVVFRTPMGGGRGYGPTHSQTLDKHLGSYRGTQNFHQHRILISKKPGAGG